MGDSTFKTPMPDNVTYGGGYIRFIKSRTEEVLVEAEVQDLVSKIETGRLAATFRNHRQHVAHVKGIVEQKASALRCPKCQGEMVKRTVKRGANAGKEFFGCKTFPKCRGILNLKLE